MKFSKSSLIFALATLTRFAMGATDHSSCIKSEFAASNVMCEAHVITKQFYVSTAPSDTFQEIWKAKAYEGIKARKGGIMKFQSNHLIFREFKSNAKRYKPVQTSMKFTSIQKVTTEIVGDDHEFTINNNAFRLNFRISGTFNAARFHDLLKKNVPSLDAFDSKVKTNMMAILEAMTQEHPISSADLINIKHTSKHGEDLANSKSVLRRIGNGKDDAEGTIRCESGDFADLQTMPKLMIQVKGVEVKLDLDSNRLLPVEIATMDNGTQKIILRKWTVVGDITDITYFEFCIATQEAAIIEEFFRSITGILNAKNRIFEVQDLENQVMVICPKVYPDIIRDCPALPSLTSKMRMVKKNQTEGLLRLKAAITRAKKEEEPQCHSKDESKTSSEDGGPPPFNPPSNLKIEFDMDDSDDSGSSDGSGPEQKQATENMPKFKKIFRSLKDNFAVEHPALPNVQSRNWHYYDLPAYRDDDDSSHEEK